MLWNKVCLNYLIQIGHLHHHHWNMADVDTIIFWFNLKPEALLHYEVENCSSFNMCLSELLDSLLC
jgi:hypothetical protein